MSRSFLINKEFALKLLNLQLKRSGELNSGEIEINIH